MTLSGTQLSARPKTESLKRADEVEDVSGGPFMRFRLETVSRWTEKPNSMSLLAWDIRRK